MSEGAKDTSASKLHKGHSRHHRLSETPHELPREETALTSSANNMPTSDSKKINESGLHTLRDAHRLWHSHSHSSSSSSTSSTQLSSELATSSASKLSSLSNVDTSMEMPQHNKLRQHNLNELLQTLPRSPKELIAQITHQQTRIRRLEDENTQLRAREVEVASLAVKLQEHFTATQSQVDSIKAQIHLQLTQPITEQEYMALETKPEHERDLLDTIKLGIYRQLNSMKSSYDAAMRKVAQTETMMAQVQEELVHTKYKLQEEERLHNSDKEEAERTIRDLTSQVKCHSQLEMTVNDLEQKLRAHNINQEEFLTAKLNAQIKTDEVAKLGIRLEEAEMEIAKHKSNYECNEQKLDILKNEFYELKLSYTQRVHELESALHASDEKLRALNELELESELFISNLAQEEINQGNLCIKAFSDDERVQRDVKGQTMLLSKPTLASSDSNMKYREWLALPNSRKMSHALTITKRCLHLENVISSLQHEVTYKDSQIARLQLSLETAREALNNSNSPYALIEKTVNELSSDNDRLHNKVNELTAHNELLQEKLKQRTADVHVLCRHRKQLVKMKKVLERLGLNVPAGALDCGEVDDDNENCNNGDEKEKHVYQHQKTNNNVKTTYNSNDDTNDNNAVHNVQGETTTNSCVPSKMQRSQRSAYHYMPLQAIEIQSERTWL